jgi:transcriptional regulator with XRE-family HTH domain
VNLTADELRKLRRRLGYTQAEMARRVNTSLETVSAWESGSLALADEFRNALLRIYQQAENAADQVARRPIAEILMKDRGLSQIHDADVVDCLADGMLRAYGFKE